MDKLDKNDPDNLSINRCMAVVDGNYFTPYRAFDKSDDTIHEMPFVTIEQGDAKYMAIAAASILAKTARDEYVIDLCKQNPVLVDRYGLDTNMGYGTKKHLDGIREHGISQWHRRTFGDACKNAPLMIIE
jgi:ribonuclease HII